LNPQIPFLTELADGFRPMAANDLLEVRPDGVALTREGLLQADRYLPPFFEPQYRGTRHTAGIPWLCRQWSIRPPSST
jgi:hypothetical protein